MPGEMLAYPRPLLEEPQFQLFLDYLPFPLAYLDRKLRFLLANRVFVELLGHSREEIVGRHALEFFKRQNHPRPRENKGEDEEEEGEAVAARVKNLPWRLTPFHDEYGEITGYILSLFPLLGKNITPRVFDPGFWSLLAAFLTEKERWLEKLFNNFFQNFLIFDSCGTVHQTNHSAIASLGLNPLELSITEIARRISFRRLNGTVLTPEESPLIRVLQGEAILGDIFILTNARGRSLPVLFSATPIIEGKNFLGAIVSWYTLGDLRPLQEAQGDYLRIISHDLRQPLTVIAAQAQLIERAAERPERVRRGAQAIYTTAWRMNALIQDLVDAAHFENGQLRLKRKEIELTSYLSDLLERLECALKTERIVVLPTPELPRVIADPDRLERIFINLLTNALKYSDPESPVTISFRPEADHLVIAIADRGRGIDPEDLPHLFSRYYRAPGVRDHTDGLGLGLYITKVLVEAHGGRIWAESTRDIGSTFYFTLPVVGARPG